MSIQTTRKLAQVAIVFATIFLLSFACALVTGHGSPLYAVVLLANIATICAALWILNQPE